MDIFTTDLPIWAFAIALPLIGLGLLKWAHAEDVARDRAQIAAAIKAASEDAERRGRHPREH